MILGCSVKYRNSQKPFIYSILRHVSPFGAQTNGITQRGGRVRLAVSRYLESGKRRCVDSIFSALHHHLYRHNRYQVQLVIFPQLL